MAQLEKIMSIYYGTDKLPYKDEDRQTHYPIAGETNTFVGENNTTKVRFFVDRIGGSNYTWVAKVKKPNGTICFRVLEMDNDDYVDVDLSFLYTDQVGQIDLALNGYTAQDITITEDDGVYEISGNPTVICTGIIKIIINYAPLILNMGATVQPNEYQQILALLSTKISYGIESEKVNELPIKGKANTIYYVKSNESDIVYDIYYWNGTTFAYLGTTAYDLYTKEDGIAFESALRSYVNTQLNDLENEIQQVASGTPKGVYATLSDLESAYPTGTSGIYVVSANGHWYYWSGSAWTDGGTYLSQLADDELDANSINPVQNKVVTKFLSPLYTKDIPNTTSRTGSYTKYSDGSQIGTGDYFSQKIIKNPTFSYIKVFGACYNDTPAVIAFYNSVNTQDASTYISGVQFIGTSPYKNTYLAKVPNGCLSIVCTSRNDVEVLGDDWVQCSNDIKEVVETENSEKLELVATSGTGNTTVVNIEKETLIKVVVNTFNFANPERMSMLVANGTTDIELTKLITGVGSYYFVVPYDVRGVYVYNTNGNIAYSVYKVTNLLNQYPVNADIRDYSQKLESFNNLDFLDLSEIKNSMSVSASNGYLNYANYNNRAENTKPLEYSDGKLTVVFNDTDGLWRYVVKPITDAPNGKLYIAGDSGWQTTNFTCSILRNSKIAIVVSKRDNSDFLISDIPSGLITLTSNNLKKNIIDPVKLEKRLELLENNAESLDKAVAVTQKNIFGKNKQYSHIFISDIADNSNPTIPCESTYDLAIAKRLGFNIAEANVQATATAGKFVVMHGISGKIGGQLVNLDGTSAGNVVINQTSFNDLRNNYKYKSIYSKYQTKIVSLEEWLIQCKMLGLTPLVSNPGETGLEIVKKYFGSDFILYNGSRETHDGMIMLYSQTMTKAQMISNCEQYKAPLMINVADLSNFATDDDLIEAIEEVHKRGCLFGICGCYMSGADAIRAYKCGADFSASDSEVNPFDYGDIYDIDGELTFDGFTTNGTISNNTISLTTGQTISVPTSNTVPFLHASQVEIIFNGSISIELPGKRNAINISSNGEQAIRWSGFAINTAPYLTITATANTVVKSIKYQAKKM